MSPAVAVFAFTACLLGFIGAHSLWRFALRTQTPSLVHAVMPLIVFYYSGAEFSSRLLEFYPSTVAVCMLAISVVSAVVIVRHEMKQTHPFN